VSSRFSLSFPGRRGEDDPWFRIGTVDVNTSLLAALLAAISMFVWAASQSAVLKLVMFPEEVRSGQIWRLFTWPFANEPDIWTVITIAMLWYFGRELERMVGRSRFAVLLVLLAVVPGLFGTLLDIPQAGIRPVEIAVFCLFAVEYPNVRFFFGVPAWVFAAVIIGIEMLQLVGYRQEERILLLLISLATAALAGRRYGLLADYSWIPKLGGGRRPAVGGGSSRSPRPARSSSRGRDFDRVVTAGPWTGPSPDDQVEMDHLLDKMNSVGLSDAERRRLTELGKRLRGS
jgi:membrane associated rhomboid family serine protease